MELVADLAKVEVLGAVVVVGLVVVEVLAVATNLSQHYCCSLSFATTLKYIIRSIYVCMLI